MHHKNIRALALALAAALCLLLVPTAAADYEPWTYEVDDQMGSYGVDYYGDVGFNDPRAGRNTTGSTSTPSTTSGVSTYSAEGAQAVAAYADENAETVSASGEYELVIPAEIEVTEGTTKKEITGKLGTYRRLSVQIVDKKERKLVCGDSGEYYIPYSVSFNNGQPLKVETDGDEKTFETNLDIKLDNLENATVSGNYTDTVAFEITCTRKMFTVTYKANTQYGGNEADDVTLEYPCGTEGTLSKNLFTTDKPNLKFTGWTLSPALSINETKVYAAGAPIAKVNSDAYKTEGGNLVLYAHWSNQWNVRIDPNGGTLSHKKDNNGKIDQSIIINESAYIHVTYYDGAYNMLLLDATKTGYHCTGFYDAQEGGNRVWLPEGNCEMNTGYYADVDSGLGRGALWMNTDKPEGGEYVFYPQWQANAYQVKYDPNCEDYTETMENSDHTYDISETLSPNRFSREGYTFAGWSTTESGVVEYADEESVVNLTAKNNATVTLYAVWKPVSESAEMIDDWIPTVNETKPVVVDMPTVDTDDATDTSADEPEQDITPDDLMITDGDEMLARMDAAFAMPYDDPAA